MSRFYLTTPIYYVNDLPHIGHIYSTLVCDTIARYRRLRGDEVHFLTGTDEHGQKIEQAAREAGLAPIELADRVVARYHELWKRLGVSHDDFVRTTEPRHRRGVEEIIRRIAASDDFYLARHEGWYCPACETFYTEKELLPGRLCPDHRSAVEWKSEENVFFRLSKYQQPLLDWYDRAQPVRPSARANEVRAFVAAGLRDLSVSRSSLQWGIPFPGHPGHVVYVWLDALINYVSALGFGATGTEADLYQRFWADGGTRLHLIGKDIIRFHAVYWPAFLMSAGLPLPTTVFAHGWWLRDHRKMSKSVGNVARPDELLDRLGPDALRWFLLREMVFGQDANFSDEAVVDRYNGDLANGIGNTWQRVSTLIKRVWAEGTNVERAEGELSLLAREAVSDYHAAMDDFAFHRALEALWKLLAETNQLLVRTEPWKLLKDEATQHEAGAVLGQALEALKIVAVGLQPIMPTTSATMLNALGLSSPIGIEAMEWGRLDLKAPVFWQALFPRVDKDAYFADHGPAPVGASGGAGAASRRAPGRAEPSSASTNGIPIAKRGPVEPGAPTGAELAPPDPSSSSPAQEPRMDSPPPSTPAATDAPAAAPKPHITYDDFMKVELRVATVKAAEEIPKSSKLVKLIVDLGDEQRTIVAGIRKSYAPEQLVGRQVVIVANLQPAKLMGVESQGMVLAAAQNGDAVLLCPEHEVPAGTRVK